MKSVGKCVGLFMVMMLVTQCTFVPERGVEQVEVEMVMQSVNGGSGEAIAQQAVSKSKNNSELWKNVLLGCGWLAWGAFVVKTIKNEIKNKKG